MPTPVASLASLHDDQVHYGAVVVRQPAVTAIALGLARRRLRRTG